MKLTLVIDTDDLEGLRDTYKVAGHFYRKYVPGTTRYGQQVSYGKIEFIKMLRKFATLSIEAHKNDVDPASLRFSKEFADVVFAEKNDTNLS